MKKIIFIIIFTLLAFGTMQVSFTQLMGSKAHFTLFDFFAPIAGGFLGSTVGIIAVLVAELGNFLLHGAEIVDRGTIIRFFPILFATLYFGIKGKKGKSKLMLLIPVLAILAFIVHPIGRTVWYFALYWTIPIICFFFKDKYLYLRALGSTFTAHAVGGAMWIWAFSLPKEVWIGLIPIVFMERMLFAAGICVSYIVIRELLGYLVKKKVLKLEFLSLHPTNN